MNTKISKIGLLGLGMTTTLFALGGVPALAQSVLSTNNGIINSSLCVGGDCATGISFGFDTLILKENNTRLFFDDTSSSASFPNNDWRLIANDSSNGGDNKFVLQDATSGRSVVSIFAGARTHAMVLDSQGDLGLGTATPATEIDIKTGDSPTIRLQQDGSSGFQAQTWDLAGNETNFFIRDVTNGSILPFRIRPGALSNSLFVDSDGDIGFGTASPTDDLHVVRSTGSVGMRLQTGDSPLIFRMALNANLDKFVLNFDDAVGPDFTLDSAGNVAILGTLTTAGSCSVGCDRVFTADYDLPSISDHSAKMFANGYLPNVGPTAEDSPFNVTDKMGRMLNELEHAHIYIDQLNTRLKNLEDALAKH